MNRTSQKEIRTQIDNHKNNTRQRPKPTAREKARIEKIFVILFTYKILNKDP